MMKVKFKMTADGEVAIVPRAEYERLRDLAREAEEDIGTARIVARARKEVAGGAPVLPKAIVDRLGKGENPVRVLRQFRHWTQDELATAVGIAQNYLSDLETGKRKGPLALHRKFANALGVPLELLSTIAVSEQESDPARFAKRGQVIADMRRSRGQR
jgi:DNA-binding XRE family transcriptional regulator